MMSVFKVLDVSVKGLIKVLQMLSSKHTLNWRVEGCLYMCRHTKVDRDDTAEAIILVRMDHTRYRCIPMAGHWLFVISLMA